MPGIVGLLTKMPRERALEELALMVESLRHETFYKVGTWADESLGLYIGWIEREDGSSAGMPLRNERRDKVLVFSGEEFPKPGLVQELKKKGHEVDGAGWSYLVHAAEEDPAFPAGLNGRFHGFLADHSGGTGLLFNDRYGMHRIYYHESKEAFYFAAEAKAILAVRSDLRSMDPQGVGDFISCGSVLENRTFFVGVHVLPPASAWLFRNGSLVRKASYFDPKEWEQQEVLDEESYYKELRHAFTQNLPRYFSGDQPIAMSLTGGLDTRMIMAWHQADPGSLPCYTFGGMRRDCKDVIVARKIASLCGQPHDVVRLGEDFLSRFAYYAQRTVYLTEGCVDVSRAPDLYLNERARQIASVRMTGNYGGEVLRRIRAFKAAEPMPGLFQPDILPYVQRSRATYRSLLQHHPVSFAVFYQGPWHHSGILALEQTQVSLRSPYLDNDLVRTVFRAPAQALATTDASLRLILEGNPLLYGIPTDRGVGGNRTRTLTAISRAVLDFQFKAEYAYDMGMPQWLARLDHTLSALHIDRLFLGRHKIFHFRVWYRDALARYVREILLDANSLSRAHIHRRSLEAIVQGHIHGVRNYTTELHKLLTLELLHRSFTSPTPVGSKSPAGC